MDDIVLKVTGHKNEAEFLKTFRSRYSAKLHNRFGTFWKIFEYLISLDKPFYSILETGMARQNDNYSGDGMSTLLFDEFVNFYDGQVKSVDINQETIDFCSKLVSKKTELVCSDSVSYLFELSKTDVNFDLIYFDSFDIDWGNPHPSSFHHVKELIAIMPKIQPGTLIVVDDNLQDKGKGQYIREFMSHIGKEPFFNEYQIGWIW